MTAMASEINSLTVVYSTVYSDADQRKLQSSASLAFVWEFTGTGEFPAQRASYAENVSIWWLYYEEYILLGTWNSKNVRMMLFCAFREKVNSFYLVVTKIRWLIEIQKSTKWLTLVLLRPDTGWSTFNNFIATNASLLPSEEPSMVTILSKVKYGLYP